MLEPARCSALTKVPDSPAGQSGARRLGESSRCQLSPARFLVPIANLLEVASRLDRFAKFLKASGGLVKGRRAPFRIGVQYVDLQQFANGLIITLLGKETFTDLKLGPGGRWTSMTRDHPAVGADGFIMALLVLAGPSYAELRLEPVLRV